MSNIIKEVKPKLDNKDIKTPLEKFAGMSKKNKNLEKLVNDFNLEITI